MLVSPQRGGVSRWPGTARSHRSGCTVVDWSLLARRATLSGSRPPHAAGVLLSPSAAGHAVVGPPRAAGFAWCPRANASAVLQLPDAENQTPGSNDEEMQLGFMASPVDAGTGIWGAAFRD